MQDGIYFEVNRNMLQSRALKFMFGISFYEIIRLDISRNILILDSKNQLLSV